ncbi:MAG: PAS domain S-box protein [Gracilimonas sp.]
MNLKEKLYSSSPFGIAYQKIILDSKGVPVDYEFLEVNETFEKLTGLSSDEIIRKKASQLPERNSLLRNHLEVFGKVAQTQKSQIIYQNHFDSDTSFDIHVWSDEKGFFGTLYIDSYEHKNATDAERSKNEFLQIFEDIPHSIFIVEQTDNKKFRVKNFNKTQLEYLNMTRDEVEGKLIEGIFPEDFAKHANSVYTECLNKGEQISYEEDLELPGRGHKYFITTLTPVKNKSGEFTEIAGSSIDITKRKVAEIALKKSEALQAKLMSNIGDVVVIIDRELNNSYKSPNIERLFGWKPEEVIGKSALALVHPDDRAMVTQFINQLLKKPNSTATYEIRYQHKDGNYRWIKFTATNLLKDPEIQGILGNYHDITEKKESESELKTQQEFNNSLLDAAADGVVACDANGDMVLFNQTAREWHGIDLMRIPIKQGAQKYNLFHLDGFTPLEPYEIPLVRAYNGEIVQNAGMAIKAKGQPIRYIRANGAPVLDDKNNKLGAVVIMRDVTEQIEMERQLRENEERLSATLHSIGDGVISCDEQGRVLSINSVAETLTGWTTEEAQGKDIDEVFKIISSENRKEASNPVRRALSEGTIVGLANHTILISKNGDEFQIADSCAPIRDSENNIIGCVLVFRDVSDEYEQREALKKSEERFRALANNVPGVIYLCENNDRYTMNFVSEQVETLTGYSSAEFLNDEISFTDLYHPDDKKWVLKKVEEALGSQEPFQLTYRIKHRSGEWRWVLEHGVGLFNEEGELKYIEGYLTDITASKQSEEIAFKASQQLAFHVENSPLAVIISDEDFRVKQWSKSAEELFGWTEEEVLKKDPNEWIFTYEEDMEEVTNKVKELTQGKKPRNLSRNRNYTKDGRVLHCEWYNSAMLDQEGAIISIFSLVHDISDRKQKEIELQESLKEKETLLAEIHHRVKNNLAVVSGMMQLQAFESEDESLQSKLFESVIRIKTMASVHELLYKSNSFSKLDFSDTITQLVENISETLSPSTAIDLNIESEHINLNINKAIPASLIVNEVVTNVYKHAFSKRDRGILSFNVYEKEDNVNIIIQDDGIGIDTKSLSNSTSLGIHLIKELSKQIDGSYEYLNTNPGTRFQLSFPKNINEESLV